MKMFKTTVNLIMNNLCEDGGEILSAMKGRAYELFPRT